MLFSSNFVMWGHEWFRMQKFRFSLSLILITCRWLWISRLGHHGFLFTAQSSYHYTLVIIRHDERDRKVMTRDNTWKVSNTGLGKQIITRSIRLTISSIEPEGLHARDTETKTATDDRRQEVHPLVHWISHFTPWPRTGNCIQRDSSFIAT